MEEYVGRETEDTFLLASLAFLEKQYCEAKIWKNLIFLITVEYKPKKCHKYISMLRFYQLIL